MRLENILNETLGVWPIDNGIKDPITSIKETKTAQTCKPVLSKTAESPRLEEDKKEEIEVTSEEHFRRSVEGNQEGAQSNLNTQEQEEVNQLIWQEQQNLQ